MFRVERLDDGIAICAEFGAELSDYFRAEHKLYPFPVGLTIWDPPYGRIVPENWDRVGGLDIHHEQSLIAWTSEIAPLMIEGGALYVWGGTGKRLYRPFYRYLVSVELATPFLLADHITWAKRRAYGCPDRYLYTREECAYLLKGPSTAPAVFNIPYLNQKRGYAGFNKKYSAKSEYLRRSNVWSDITELFRGKIHPTQKPDRLFEVIIETHTNPGDWVFDPMAGSFTTARAARKSGRKWICVEKDPEIFETGLKTLR